MLVVLLGCGTSSPPQFEVRGRVTYKQAAILNGSVTFAPQGGGELIVVGISDGDYQLQAPAATYEVAVTAMGEVAEGREGFEQKATRPQLPSRFSHPSRSGIVVSVEEKEINQIDLALE